MKTRIKHLSLMSLSAAVMLSGLGSLTTSDISAVMAAVFNRLSRMSSQAGAKLHGSNTLTPQKTGSNQYTCTINLNPTITRLKRTDIQTSGTVITGYKAEGLFVNNSYSKTTINNG